jgi:gamma-glutamyl-gamma-aminobutyrate hydrolase PuuD
MPATPYAPRIGFYGTDDLCPQEKRGCALWAAGYAAALTEAGATPVLIELPRPGASWGDALESLDGLLFLGHPTTTGWQAAAEERLVLWCQERQLPFLGVDGGLHALTTALGGSLFTDLVREQPQALQHQHLPEKGDRHALNTVPDTRIAACYGEGEIIVNSEHRKAVNKPPRGFRVSATALDGVTEAVEAEDAAWYAVGVQWQPASASASGLDIQLFRGLVDAGRERHLTVRPAPLLAAA